MSYVLKLIKQLLFYYDNTAEDESHDDELDQVISQVLSQRTALEISAELRELKHIASASRINRLQLTKLAQTELESVDNAALSANLDANKRSKIVSETMEQLQDSVRRMAKLVCLQKASWESFWVDYTKSKFEKNVEGQICDSVFASSQTHDGLTAKVLAEMSWQLARILRLELQRFAPFTRSHCDSMVLLVVQPFMKHIISLWQLTAVISHVGSKNSGVVVERWKVEAEHERAKLDAIKLRGADAKYTPATYEPADAATLSPREIRATRKRLSHLLQSMHDARPGSDESVSASAVAPPPPPLPKACSDGVCVPKPARKRRVIEREPLTVREQLLAEIAERPTIEKVEEARDYTTLMYVPQIEFQNDHV